MRWTLLTLVIASGCAPTSLNDDRPPSTDDNPMTTEIPAPFAPPDDIVYIDALTEHHRAAMEMATEEVERGADPAVLAMAQAMIDVQSAEIDELSAIRRARTDAGMTPMQDDPHMDDDMSALEALTGVALDREFLRQMIPHHAGAIELSHRAEPNLTDARLIELAQQVQASQATEIGTMRADLDRLEGWSTN